MMPKIVDKIVDIDIFQDVFGAIDQNFIKSIVSIVSLFNDRQEFLMMTNDSTFAYGERICKMLSLKFDKFKPQKISLLDDMKIVQVDSGDNFVVILTNDGRVYLASSDNAWDTKKTFKLITVSNNDDRFKMIACGESDFLLLRNDGIVIQSITTYVPNSNRNGPKRIEIINCLSNVKLIACGGHSHYFASTNREKLCLWQYTSEPTFLQISSNSINNRIKDIAYTKDFPSILLENGQLYFYKEGIIFGEKYLYVDHVPSLKLVLSQVEKIATSKYSEFVLAYSNSSYYVYGKIHKNNWSSFTKLNTQFESFAAIIERFTPSPLTFGLTSTFYQLEDCNHPLPKPEESIRRLFNNPDNYDVEFIIGKKQQRIVASKCYLKSVSEYFSKMLSGKWLENDRIMIDTYSYDTYYSYLNMLHCGNKDSIKINADNIGEFTDLAHCYCDEKLLGYCKNFIRKELNEKTLEIYLPIVVKYQLDGFNDKLRQITFENVLPKIQNESIPN
uniref:Uncharacterized protein LOC113794789 n=1 Tax=Dermatophagoides pteronyssinus TaxID=6956 RepID=A0A6P6Y601_DERPT|nr:uncharacterized protein LOC113794789 [Dermatophagoides pteronyssinus]